jgi:hypothetical protein
MDLFVTVKAFNPDLKGKAVKIKGHDTRGKKWNSIYFVKHVEVDRIYLINYLGNEFVLRLKDFEKSNDLTLTVWEDEQ